MSVKHGVNAPRAPLKSSLTNLSVGAHCIITATMGTTQPEWLHQHTTAATAATLLKWWACALRIAERVDELVGEPTVPQEPQPQHPCY